MPFRDQGFREICGEDGCDAWASGECLRCGKPLCQDHAASDKRCDECERQYRGRARRIYAPKSRTAETEEQLTRMSLVAGSAIPGIALTVVIAPLGLALLVAGPALTGLALRLKSRPRASTLRRKFLAERSMRSIKRSKR
jgi:hypothetical protein